MYFYKLLKITQAVFFSILLMALKKQVVKPVPVQWLATAPHFGHVQLKDSRWFMIW